jgi:hypothetical protein
MSLSGSRPPSIGRFSESRLSSGYGLSLKQRFQAPPRCDARVRAWTLTTTNVEEALAHASFNGLRVLALESRRAKEVGKLILT